MNKNLLNCTNCLFFVGMMLFVSGCGDSNPVVPEHPFRSKFIGTWNDDNGDTHYNIIPFPDGPPPTVVIHTDDKEEWDSKILNIRFEGNDLKFDHYNYYTGTSDDFINYPNYGNHPQHGECKSITLKFLEDDQSRLKMLVSNSSESTTMYLIQSEK